MNTNILIERYPEITEFSSNIPEKTLISSEIDIDIDCKGCNKKYKISVKSILKKPFCEKCVIQILQQPVSKEFLLEATIDIIKNQSKNCTVKPKNGIYSKHKKYQGKESITSSESSRTSSTSSTKSLNYQGDPLLVLYRKKKDKCKNINNKSSSSCLTVPQLKQRLNQLNITYRSKDTKTILLEKIQKHSQETLFEYCNTEDESKYNLPEEDTEYKGIEIGKVLKDILENSEMYSGFIDRLKSINQRIKRQIEEKI